MTMFKYLVLSCIFMVLPFIPTYGWADDVKVFLDDESRTDFITTDKMDCSVYKSKKGLTIGFKVGTVFFGVGPEFTFGGEHQINWDRTAQSILLRYKELCSRFNTGIMTKKEYDERVREIDVIAKEAMEFQEKVLKRIKDESQSAFNELDKETVKRGFGEKDIGKRIDEIGLKVEKLPLLTQKEGVSDSFEQGIKRVVAEGIAQIGDDTTPLQAKAIALNNARRRAIEEVVGVAIHGSSILYNSELISDLVIAATKGLIVKEEILEGSGIKEEGGRHVYKILLKADVRPQKLERMGEFKIVKAEVFKPTNTAVSSQPMFQDNDEIQIKVMLNADAYINIFSVDQNGIVNKLFPNQYVEDGMLSGGRDFLFPDESVRTLGLRLRAKTPQNLSRAVESLLIIAAKVRVDLLSFNDKNEATITDLMAELSELAPSLWTEKTIGYEVRR